MKTASISLLLATMLFAGPEKPQPPFPQLPESLILSDGYVIKKGVVRKCGPELVVFVSGAGVIKSARYEALPDDVRSQLEQFRLGGPRWFPGETSGNTDAIEGQLFIQTNGAGAYKFGNTTVYAFDLALLSAFSSDRLVRLPKPINQVDTDGDGKFVLKVPRSRPYFIFAQAHRLLSDGGVERIEWRVPMSAVRKGKTLSLSSDYRFPYSYVEIEPQS